MRQCYSLLRKILELFKILLDKVVGDISWLWTGINETDQALPISNCYKSVIFASSSNHFYSHQFRKREFQDAVVTQ